MVMTLMSLSSVAIPWILIRPRQARVHRFEREIQALHQALASEESKCVIPIVEDNEISIRSDRGGPTRLKYYVMENADSDLATFLAEKELQVPQKMALCN